MSEEIELQNFEDRISTHPHRRKLTIVSQTPTEIIADIERADENIAIVGTKINSNDLQSIIDKINNLEDKIGEVAGSFVYVDDQFKSQLSFISDPQTQITDEGNARKSAVNNLQEQLTNEATTRANTYSALENSINERVKMVDLVDKIYPVGSIYMSVNSVSPATLFGGVWESLQGRFLFGSDSMHSLGAMGGEEMVTLTKDQMPVHTHIQEEHTHTQDAHRHSVWSGKLNAWSGNTNSIQSPSADGVGATESSADISDGGRFTEYVASNVNYPIISTVSPRIEVQTAVNREEGKGYPHNNMPPYLVVNMWKRTA